MAPSRLPTQPTAAIRRRGSVVLALLGGLAVSLALGAALGYWRQDGLHLTEYGVAAAMLAAYALLGMFFDLWAMGNTLARSLAWGLGAKLARGLALVTATVVLVRAEFVAGTTLVPTIALGIVILMIADVLGLYLLHVPSGARLGAKRLPSG